MLVGGEGGVMVIPSSGGKTKTVDMAWACLCHVLDLSKLHRVTTGAAGEVTDRTVDQVRMLADLLRQSGVRLRGPDNPKNNACYQAISHKLNTEPIEEFVSSLNPRNPSPSVPL